MESEAVSVALIVATRGRMRELEILFESLAAQDFKNFEIIIVDQNDDNRLGAMCEHWQSTLKMRRLWTPSERGASRARNMGWAQTGCPIVLFPDDDCWYPPSFLSRVLNTMQSTDADIVCGRAADTRAQDINGRFEGTAQWVTRENVWTTQIEWMIIFRLTALQAVSGFDPTIGVGASTPWQSCEGQDIVLRAMAKGLKCYYDNSLYGPGRKDGPKGPRVRARAGLRAAPPQLYPLVADELGIAPGRQGLPFSRDGQIRQGSILSKCRDRALGRVVGQTARGQLS